MSLENSHFWSFFKALKTGSKNDHFLWSLTVKISTWIQWCYKFMINCDDVTSWSIIKDILNKKKSGATGTCWSNFLEFGKPDKWDSQSNSPWRNTSSGREADARGYARTTESQFPWGWVLGQPAREKNCGEDRNVVRIADTSLKNPKRGFFWRIFLNLMCEVAVTSRSDELDSVADVWDAVTIRWGQKIFLMQWGACVWSIHQSLCGTWVLKKESFKSDRFDECEIECSEIEMRIGSLIKKKNNSEARVIKIVLHVCELMWARELDQGRSKKIFVWELESMCEEVMKSRMSMRSMTKSIDHENIFGPEKINEPNRRSRSSEVTAD